MSAPASGGAIRFARAIHFSLLIPIKLPSHTPLRTLQNLTFLNMNLLTELVPFFP